MTYPPQQPRPGGWDQPSGEGSGLPENQQPAFYGNQHAGLGPAGPDPAAEQPTATFTPPAQPSFPPAPGWGGGSGAWEPEPDFAADEPPKRRALPWVLGGVGALVLAGAVGGGFLLFGGADPGPARPVAEQLVDKVNAGDFGSVGPELCAANRAELEQQLGQLSAGRFELELGPVTEDGEQARAELRGTYELGGASMPVRQTIQLQLEGGAWKVCRLAA